MGAPVGNNNAGKGRMWSDAVRRALIQEDPRTQRKKLDALADKLVAMALEGDVTAIKEVGDRIDGKPVATTEISGPEGGPVEVSDRPRLSKEEWLRLHAVGPAAGQPD